MTSTQQIEPLPPVLQRFLRYVSIDTQSAENIDAYPSTERQKDLGRLLVDELRELGLEDAEMDAWGMVTATLPATPGVEAPTIGLIAHMDTSPEVSGSDIRPIVHSRYDGGDIALPHGDIVLSPKSSPALTSCVGHDLVTSDGRTLLGADDKAGIAEIVTAVHTLLEHPERRHGPIRIAFTCDEEVGRGTLHFDIDAYGADAAYTVDGEAAGEIENETFCADLATVKLVGQNVHPGYAKGKLVSAIKGAASLVAALPKNEAPETTADRQGYLHPVALAGTVEEATVKLLVRDFEEAGLVRLEGLLQDALDRLLAQLPGLQAELHITKQYRNMRPPLEQHPEIVDRAMEAVRRAGGAPKLTYARGGTDGATLTEQGLPCPNLFAGGHEFHSRTEWISVQDMELSVKVLIELAQIWAETPA